MRYAVGCRGFVFTDCKILGRTVKTEACVTVLLHKLGTSNYFLRAQESPFHSIGTNDSGYRVQ